ncbi:response regulator [Rhodoflexus caldus]|uniref:response regulator n=1 Tax=Rhodoflexus caldus TaxID=2891236 RepID=UPI002029EC80|nr:response regulator transcription factor [Rhodoflexus caldus]
MKILIAEDLALNADTLELALRQAIPTCEEIRKVGNGEQVLQMWAEWQPNLIIIDLVLPVIDGAEVIRRIRNKDSKVLLLATSMYKDRRMIKQALDAGANGFFFKGSNFDKLIHAVQSVLAGKPYIDDSIIELLLTSQRNDSTQLTPQELRVLNLLAAGKSSEQIADLLNISVATVKFHRSNLLSKSGKKNVAELVHWATTQQLI